MGDCAGDGADAVMMRRDPPLHDTKNWHDESPHLGFATSLHAETVSQNDLSVFLLSTFFYCVTDSWWCLGPGCQNALTACVCVIAYADER